ncbi:MAG: FkbM family methyltransferase [Alphaproteobacteria bacterium]|nr:FkbM family methyltransferase [Alphaproteobacteria bacterium]MBV8406084.1 FkbM family methyltransferase [Alphaproteobacteria bacterium]
MRVGRRKLDVVVPALFQKRHYTAARNMLKVYAHPLDGFVRYILGSGRYPDEIEINPPAGPSLVLTVYSYDDLLTVNEIFCRVDYPATRDDKVIVDFGSNIGISAAYFLASAPESFAYLYEPLPSNVDRLRRNLGGFAERYALRECAVGLSNDQVRFGWEPTGRYGGIGLETGNYVSVPCQDSNEILEEIIEKHGWIDILKIDIETLESEVTERIPTRLAGKIDRIYVEYTFDSNPLESTHTCRQYGNVAQFLNKRRRDRSGRA